MLADSAFIQEQDTHTFNKRRARKGLPVVTPIYTQEDARRCMSLFIGVPNNMKFRIDDNLKVRFTNAGHMLGAGVANLEVTENGVVKRLAYTGDIGRPGENRILAHPDPFPQADYLITESTYGNRLHSDNIAAEEELLKVIIHTCVNKRGKLIIPAFSVGRTQEVVYALNNFFNAGRLPKIDIFVDSPLAINATTVFRAHPECCNQDFLKAMEKDPDPFGFSNLHYITHQEQSKKLNKTKKPCIIISASGMMEAGRVKHHLANNISNPKNTVLAVGYCSPVTLGARILRGDREVSIHGKVYKVRAEIRELDSFSGHADYNEMMKFLECQDKDAIKKLFLVHGEYEVQKKYMETLKQAGFKNIEIPERGQVFEI
jgi:metallo-beta-lactamase family protein